MLVNSLPVNVIAQGALTNSKRPESFIQGVYPTHITHGHGCYLFDTKGKRYIDYICGLGTNYFGYANPVLVEIQAQYARLGNSHSFPTVMELELGQALKNLFHLEKFKFYNSGTEGCMAAVLMARAYDPRRMVVLSEGYHGWSNMFIGLTEPALGVVKDTSMKKLGSDIYLHDWANVGAVIVEPIITDHSPARIQWLRDLQVMCQKHNVCMIYDETITAYRFPNYTAYQYYDLKPDIVVAGKALANGLKISVVGGSSKYLENPYFSSGSYCGELVTLAVAKECARLITLEYKPDALWQHGQDWLIRFNALSEHIKIEGYPTRGVFVGDPMFKALFWQEACIAGVLFGPSWWYTKALHKEADNVLNICQTIVSRINNGQVSLKGKLPVQPFAQKVRE